MLAVAADIVSSRCIEAINAKNNTQIKKTMKEEDILYENGELWICESKAYGYILNKNVGTHSVGFLSFSKIEHAKDNCDALAERPDLVAKLIK